MKKHYYLILLAVLLSAATMSYANQTVKLRVQVPAQTVVCYATGGFNGWNTSATPMTKVSDSPKIFEADISVPDNVDAGYGFKFLAGPDWKYEQGDPSADFTYGAVGWTGAVVNSFKQYFTPMTPRDIKVNVLVPSTTLFCYITGTFANWEQPAKQMTFVSQDQDGKVYTYTIPNIDPQLLEFKFASGPSWAYEQTQGNFTYLGNGGDNNEVSVVCSGFKAIYDPVNVGDITVNITSVPAGTDSVYLVGSFKNGWKLEEAIPATKNNDGSFTAVITQVADVEFKCWNRRDWAYEECQPDGSNIPNRQYKFKDTPVANITIAKWKKMATGIDELKSDFTYPVSVSDRKVTVDGVVSGVSLYNISGQLIQNFKGNGKFVSRPLTSGVYILQVDNTERKVMVD